MPTFAGRPPLRLVTDPAPEHPVLSLIADLHLLKRAKRDRHTLERTLETARRAGNEGYARHVEDAVRSLHLAERRARG